MYLIGAFIITCLTNIIFYRWYTSEIAKELEKIEKRVDKKLLFFRENH
ncbi:hypothetical protein IGI91_001465 [Enterococcus sp. AZ154]